MSNQIEHASLVNGSTKTVWYFLQVFAVFTNKNRAYCNIFNNIYTFEQVAVTEQELAALALDHDLQIQDGDKVDGLVFYLYRL